MGYAYLYVGLTKAEAEATHRAMVGCPVKTPALQSATAEMAQLLERWAKHERGKR